MALVIDDKDLDIFLETTLTEISVSRGNISTQKCPRCSTDVRFPVVARKRDIDDFKRIMNITYDVIGDYGVMTAILNDIRVKCIASLAIEKAKEEARK